MLRLNVLIFNINTLCLYADALYLRSIQMTVWRALRCFHVPCYISRVFVASKLASCLVSTRRWPISLFEPSCRCLSLACIWMRSMKTPLQSGHLLLWWLLGWSLRSQDLFKSIRIFFSLRAFHSINNCITLPLFRVGISISIDCVPLD